MNLLLIKKRLPCYVGIISIVECGFDNQTLWLNLPILYITTFFRLILATVTTDVGLCSKAIVRTKLYEGRLFRVLLTGCSLDTAFALAFHTLTQSALTLVILLFLKLLQTFSPQRLGFLGFSDFTSEMCAVIRYSVRTWLLSKIFKIHHASVINMK